MSTVTGIRYHGSAPRHPCTLPPLLIIAQTSSPSPRPARQELQRRRDNRSVTRGQSCPERPRANKSSPYLWLRTLADGPPAGTVRVTPKRRGRGLPLDRRPGRWQVADSTGKFALPLPRPT